LTFWRWGLRRLSFGEIRVFGFGLRWVGDNAKRKGWMGFWVLIVRIWKYWASIIEQCNITQGKIDCDHWGSTLYVFTYSTFNVVESIVYGVILHFVLFVASRSNVKGEI
jgi:hypothetical protein